MTEEENLHDKLVKFFNLFDNNTYFLIDFLLKKEAFNKDFLTNLAENKDLADIQKIPNDFGDILETQEWLVSLFDDFEIFAQQTSELEKELNNKLKKALLLEKYEEAFKIQKMMIKNGLKINI